MFSLLGNFSAQDIDDTEEIDYTDIPKINHNPMGCQMDWMSKDGRHYFTEYSNDMESWSFMPAIRTGDGSMLSTGFQCSSPELFLRLHWSDLDDGGDVNTADFDGDGLANFAEINQPIGQQTNPLLADTDGDGLLDGWEVFYSLNPNSKDTDGDGTEDGDEDPDNDGQTNSQEQGNGTNPNPPGTGGPDDPPTDSDGDGVPDSLDGWALCSRLSPERKDPPKYAVIELVDVPSGAWINNFEINNDLKAIFTVYDTDPANYKNYYYGNGALKNLDSLSESSTQIKIGGLSEEGYFLQYGKDGQGGRTKLSLFWNGAAHHEGLSVKGWPYVFPAGNTTVGYKKPTYGAYCVGPGGTVYGRASYFDWYEYEYDAGTDSDGKPIKRQELGSKHQEAGVIWTSEDSEVSNSFIGTPRLSHYRDLVDYSDPPNTVSDSVSIAQDLTPEYGTTFIKGIFVPEVEDVKQKPLIEIIQSNEHGVNLAIREQVNDYWSITAFGPTGDSQPADGGGDATRTLGYMIGSEFHALGEETTHNKPTTVSSGISSRSGGFNNRNTILTNSSDGVTMWIDSQLGHRHNQTPQGNPSYQKLVWDTVWGPEPPLNLNADMRGFSEGFFYLGVSSRLWFNAEWHSILGNSIPEKNLIDSEKYTWIKVHDINDNDALAAELTKTDGKKVAALLLPVELNHVDRDVVKRLWDSNRTINSADKIYSGVFDGDMIEWRIKGLQNSNLNISWFAEDQDGARLTGPSGIGVNYWQISDGSEANNPTNTPDSKKWLNWNPGRYKIICKIDGQESVVSEFNLGWRTRTMVVIGQIVPTTTHDPDEPTGAALSSWAEALADDFTYGLGYGGTGILDQAVFGVVKAGFAQVPTKATEAWMGYWSTGLPLPVAPPLPPASAGPFTSSLATTPRGARGTVTASQRYWMIQHMLNVNDDKTSISSNQRYPNQMNSRQFSTAFVEQQYRILHRFRAKFFLNNSNQIDAGTIEVFHHNAKNGPTKLNFDVQVGEFGTTPALASPPVPPLPVPPFALTAPILTEPSETNPHNQTLNVASDNLALSSYASARIALKGQRGSYRLFGKDAPWIFSEIIFEVGNDRKIKMKVGTSVTTEWVETNTAASADAGGTMQRASSAPASTPGLCPFNNLNIYDRRPEVVDDPSSEYIYSRRGLLEMEGHVKCFVESASGAWPEPPTTPSVK